MSITSRSRSRLLTIAATAALVVPGSLLLGGTAYADQGGKPHHASQDTTSQDSSNSSPSADQDKSHGNAKSHDQAGSKQKGNGSTPHQVKTTPQEPSKADDSGHGANQHGPYDSTRDGSPSANGNGNGKAGGKPCAGCVGKADNKNPKGQLPGGSDHNNGYECDGNHGIGRGNPAHTGCTAAVVTPPTEDCDGDSDGSLPADADCTEPTPPTEDCDGDSDGSRPTDADCTATTPHKPGTDVEGTKTTKTPEVLGHRVTRSTQGSVLPFTGSHLDEGLVTGVLLLVVGVAGVLLGRRREV